MENQNDRSDLIQHGLDHRSTYRFARIAALNARAFAAVFARRFRLTVNGWKILTVIGRHAPMSANAASAHSALEPDKVTRAVDVLVKQGYVLRRQDPLDRRRVVLSLSTRGQRVHDELNRMRDLIEHEFLSVLSRTEVAHLYRILDKLEANVVSMFSNKRSLAAIIAGFEKKKPKSARRLPRDPAVRDRAGILPTL
jgi:DNA-binding MarR family transcriptional regulator